MPVDLTKPFCFRPYATERNNDPLADRDEQAAYDDGAESNAVAALERAIVEIAAEILDSPGLANEPGLQRACDIITRLLETKP